MGIRRFLVAALAVSGLCAADALKSFSLAPSIVVAVPSGWTAARDSRASYLLEHRGATASSDATTSVRIEHRPSHADALKRIASVYAGDPAHSTYVVIAGWPAVERRSLVPFQHPGEGDASAYRGSAEKTYRVITAVAAGTYVVRFDTLLQPGAPPSLADDALTIARRLTAPGAQPAETQTELRSLPTSAPPRVNARVRAPAAIARGPVAPRAPRTRGGSQRVGGAGEIEAAASNDGTQFVTDAACAISYSGSGGQTFAASAVNWTGIPPGLDGDCTVTWGPSGNFYLGQLASSGANQYVAFAKSTDGGAHFNYVTLAVNRSTGQPGATNVDQPHIAADRWNASSSGGDMVYVVWHETGNFVSRVACSSNSGTNWGSPVPASSGTFGFPRVAVGRDGMVYVVSRTWENQIDVDKFSSCDAGLVEQLGFPQTYTFTDLYGSTCSGGAVTGLDRCNDGNTLASPTIAVDDTDAGHVYLGWAQANAAQTGQDIYVNDFRADSGGNVTFGTPAAADGGATAKRFMPWLGVWGGVAYTGWYDRRTAGTTVAHPNDATRYYRGSVSLRHGALVAGQETDLMGTDDQHCASGWGAGTRELQDATQCTIQPQNAASGGGFPKYGDYNGLAVGGGRILNIWASGTAPSDLAATGNHTIHAYVAVSDLPSSFFVRDWTVNASSHDGGEEPSTSAAFYDTSDVWDQATNVVEPLVNDWVAGDLPVRGAQSYAFARVSRRAPAASTLAATTISADFLMADFGLGVPFADLGSESVTMNAAQSTAFTPGHAWTLPATASSHVCLAVQLSVPGDPYAPPSLLGGSPGPSGTDPNVVGDNKKAQRNLLLTSGAGGAGGEAFAIVHNGARVRRDIVVQMDSDPRSATMWRAGTAGVVGAKPVPLARGGRIVFAAMAPGEDRWLGVRFDAVTAPNGSLSIVRFSERGNGGVANGFAIGYRRVPLAAALGDRLRTASDVLGRLSAVAKDTRIAGVSADARRLVAGSAAPAAPQYRAAVASRIVALRAVAARQIAAAGSDPFNVSGALATLSAAMQSNDDERVAIADDAVLQRIDAHLTWEARRKR